MARMSDEKYEFMQDTKEKKITARSAKYTRSHCGKRGAVRLPSDNLSAKELKKMNGECKSYRMNSPMTWGEFKAMPNDLKIIYIKALRKAYNVPDKEIAEMFGVSSNYVCKYFGELGLSVGKSAGGNHRVWEKDAWYIWRGIAVKKAPDCYTDGTEKIAEGSDTDEVKEEALAYIENDIKVVGEVAEKVGEDLAALERAAQRAASEQMNNDIPEPDYCYNLSVASKGEMSFEGNVDDILRTLGTLLQNKKVRLTVKWSITEDEMSKAAQYALLNTERRKRLNSKG